MRIEWIVSVLLIIRIAESYPISCQTGQPNDTSDGMASAISSVNDPVQLSHTLYQWCSQDPTCSGNYFGQKRPNATLFRFLTRKLVASNSLYAPINQLVCQSNSDSETVNKNLWMMMLSNERYLQPLCGPNYVPSLSSDGVSVDCVCDTGSNCDSVDTDRILLYVIAGLMVFLTLLLVMIDIYRIVLQTRAYKQCATSKMEIEELLKKLM